MLPICMFYNIFSISVVFELFKCFKHDLDAYDKHRGCTSLGSGSSGTHSNSSNTPEILNLLKNMHMWSIFDFMEKKFAHQFWDFI